MSFCQVCRAAAQIVKYVAGIDAHKLNAFVKVGSHGRTASRGRIADDPNMKNVHITFYVRVYRIKFIITAIQRIDREEHASFKRRNLKKILIVH